MDKFIEALKYALIAIVQGVAEVLPISSSAHIFLTEKLLGMESNLTLAIFLHFGSLIAVIVYFRKQIWLMIKYFFGYLFKSDRSDEARYYFKLDINLIIASIPAAVLGFVLKSTIENNLLALLPIGISLIVTAIVLYVVSKINGQKEIKDMKWHEALIVGLFQGIGLIPGISRSGITISGLKTTKFNNKEAANFAFLMFIPVSLGSFMVELLDIFQGEVSFESAMVLNYIIGIVLATAVTLLSVHFLLRIIKKGRLWYFSFYCLAVGIAAIIWHFIQ